jgi:hypothetical protein
MFENLLLFFSDLILFLILFIGDLFMFIIKGDQIRLEILS